MPCPRKLFENEAALLGSIFKHSLWDLAIVNCNKINIVLLQKPADLDLQCFQKRINPGSAGQGLTFALSKEAV